MATLMTCFKKIILRLNYNSVNILTQMFFNGFHSKKKYNTLEIFKYQKLHLRMHEFMNGIP